MDFTALDELIAQRGDVTVRNVGAEYGDTVEMLASEFRAAIGDMGYDTAGYTYRYNGTIVNQHGQIVIEVVN